MGSGELLWTALIDRISAAPDVSTAAGQWFAKLSAAYSSSDRHYHNLDHVEAMIGRIPDIRHEIISVDAFELAAWFHDAVYDSRRNDNEEHSAMLLDSAAVELSLPVEVAGTARRWILATKSHDPKATDAAAFCDADLAVLGSSPEVYDRYRMAIRLEYAWVAGEQYRAGRSRVLRSFLDRQPIFRTPKMFELFESTARRNLDDELTMLGRGRSDARRV